MNVTKTETANDALTGSLFRLIMFVDKQANGATATVTDILESANIMSFRNLANSGRFIILMDRTMDMNCNAGGGNGSTTEYGTVETYMSFNKSCNIPIEFSSTTGAITEIRSNNIGILSIASANNTATLDSKIRIRFSDS